jgi:hypothetical protein
MLQERKFTATAAAAGVTHNSAKKGQTFLEAAVTCKFVLNAH